MGRNWAITIGINQYDNLQPLDFAQRDAESMREFFLQDLRVKPEETYHFAKGAPRLPAAGGKTMSSRPAYVTLRQFLRWRFEKPFLKTGDNLWFFFAGHGIRHEGRDYLMPLDADPGDVDDTAISLNFVTERLHRSGADNVILLIDACRNIGAKSGEGVGQSQKGVVSFFSCSPEERSWEIPELEQGAFTHTLLEGLRLQGAANCATVERLYRHVSVNLPRLNAQYGKPRQTPSSFVEPSTKNHLILLPKQATLADCYALKFQASQAENRGEFALARELWIRIWAAFPSDPDALESIERIARLSSTPARESPASEPSATASSREAVLETEPETIAEPPSQSLTFSFEYVTVNERGNIAERRTGEAERYQEALGDGLTLEMVKIPGGKFVMGSPENELERTKYEGPQHEVMVQSFLLGRYPVTQAQWRFVAGLPQVERALDPDPSKFKGDLNPVEQVSWDEAVEFCQRLSRYAGREYRLPSEAECEYACRAGTTTPFHFGETISTVLANYRGTDNQEYGWSGSYGNGPRGKYRQQTTPVNQFKIANAFGLCDIHGNVWEWCEDAWHGSYQGAPTNGSAWTAGGNQKYKVVRGGSWIGYPRYCRSAFRSYDTRGNRDHYLGFRVCCSAPETL